MEFRRGSVAPTKIVRTFKFNATDSNYIDVSDATVAEFQVFRELSGAREFDVWMADGVTAGSASYGCSATLSHDFVGGELCDVETLRVRARIETADGDVITGSFSVNVVDGF